MVNTDWLRPDGVQHSPPPHRLPLGPSDLWQLPIILVYAGPPTVMAANSRSPRRGRRTHGVTASYRARPPTKPPCIGSTPPPDCQVGPFLSTRSMEIGSGAGEMGWTWKKAKGCLRKRGDKDSGAEVTVNPCVESGEVGIELQRISLLNIRCKTRVCVVVWF